MGINAKGDNNVIEEVYNQARKIAMNDFSMYKNTK